ncbi:MAG: metallophosphoesterase [Gammaproteobacteria bacterium]|jgi:3',5'-cyclic AMP phosphodiesterase CpdA|nr:metallophosphoesterase [Gammaproteobacteria bacterium]
MKSIIKIVLLVLIVSVGLRQTQIMLDSRPDGALGPWLQHGTGYSMRVFWYSATATPTTASLYLPTHEQPLQTVQMNAASRFHSVAFKALVPGQLYEYQWGKAGDRATFQAPPDRNNSDSVRLWVLGDPGSDGRTARQVHAAAMDWMASHSRSRPVNPDLILTSGDNAYTSGRFHEYRDALFKPLARQLAETPFWPAYGNHDARRRAFFKIFRSPDAGESGGTASNNQHYYAYDYGLVHVVMLDSQSSLRWGKASMLDWLKLDLQQNNLPWTIVVLHHPPYSKGSNDSDAASGSDWRQRVVREQIVPVLERAGVDLVLAGHSHSYERSHLLNGHYGKSTSLTDSMILQRGAGIGDRYALASGCKSQCGTVYVVLGNSSKVNPAPLDHPAMAYASATAGSLIIDIKQHCLSARMIDNQGQQADAFKLLKPAAGGGSEHDCEDT